VAAAGPAGVGESATMKGFLSHEEEEVVAAAIREAEERTSGEIRVAVVSRRVWRIRHHAWRLFHRLGMDRTRDRNAVLIAVFVKRRRFMVIGDEGIHRRMSAAWWQTTADAMSASLRDGQSLEAVCDAVRRIGNALREHWPLRADNPDELSDRVHRD
jgi:uncharacterized membrane protein